MIFEPVILDRLLRRGSSRRARSRTSPEAIRLDLHDRLPNDLLTRTDRATMGASIEARVPFLSHEMVTYCSLGIDETLLINGHTQKYLLKKLAETLSAEGEYLPPQDRLRPAFGGMAARTAQADG